MVYYELFAVDEVWKYLEQMVNFKQHFSSYYEVEDMILILIEIYILLLNSMGENYNKYEIIIIIITHTNITHISLT